RKSLTYLQHTIDGLLHRQRPVFLEDAREVAALEVLHHHIWRAVVERAGIEHEHHVIALDLAHRTRLALEARAQLVAVEGAAKELDRDGLLELDVRRRNDDARTALADEPLDAVLLQEDVACRDGQAAEAGLSGAHRDPSAYQRRPLGSRRPVT